MQQRTEYWFEKILIPRQVRFHNGIWISNDLSNTRQNWSFTQEWREHSKTNQQRTWDMTAEKRLENFYKETQTNPEFIRDKVILDAGCGNGQLTMAIAQKGAFVIGIDRQPHLPAVWSNNMLKFVQADFDSAPFYNNSFHIVIANGSIHHTANAKNSFSSLSKLVKPGGRLYIWVYKKPNKWKDKFLLWWLDFFRFFICRFPPSLQKFSVTIFTHLFYWLSRIRKGENSARTIAEIRINIFDAFTPRYRSYHTQQQIMEWLSIIVILTAN